jgi:hypothetical protein
MTTSYRQLLVHIARLDEDRLLAAKRRFDAMLAEPGPQVMTVPVLMTH